MSTLSNLNDSQKDQKQSKLLGSFAITENPENSTNLLALCHQQTYLLHKQIEGLGKKHEKEVGYSEKLYNARIKYLKKFK